MNYRVVRFAGSLRRMRINHSAATYCPRWRWQSHDKTITAARNNRVRENQSPNNFLTIPLEAFQARAGFTCAKVETKACACGWVEIVAEEQLDLHLASR